MNMLSLTLFVVVAEAHAVDGVVAVVEALVVVDAAVAGAVVHDAVEVVSCLPEKQSKLSNNSFYGLNSIYVKIAHKRGIGK